MAAREQRSTTRPLTNPAGTPIAGKLVDEEACARAHKRYAGDIKNCPGEGKIIFMLFVRMFCSRPRHKRQRSMMHVCRAKLTTVCLSDCKNSASISKASVMKLWLARTVLKKRLATEKHAPVETDCTCAYVLATLKRLKRVPP